jgi:hypothetical protein
MKLNSSRQRQFLIRPASLSRFAFFKQITEPFVLSKFEFSLLVSVILYRDLSRERSFRRILELLLRTTLVVFNSRSSSLLFFFLFTRSISATNLHL